MTEEEKNCIKSLFRDTAVEALDKRIDQRFIETDKRLEQRFHGIEVEMREGRVQMRSETASALTAAKEAVGKAEAATERRFENVNEFRATLSDQAQTFVSKAEWQSETRGLAARISTLELAQSAIGGRSTGFNASWGVIVQLVGWILLALGLLWKGH
jgi:hypothetical protein